MFHLGKQQEASLSLDLVIKLMTHGFGWARQDSTKNWLVSLPLEALTASFGFLLGLQRRWCALYVETSTPANRLIRLTDGYAHLTNKLVNH